MGSSSKTNSPPVRRRWLPGRNHRAALALLTALVFHQPLPAANNFDPSTNAPAPPRENVVLREYNQRVAAEEQERFRVRIAIPDAVGADLAQEYAARRAARQNPPPTPVLPGLLSRITGTHLLLAALGLVAAALTLRKMFPQLGQYLNPNFNPWAAIATPGELERLRAEESTLDRFLQTFDTGPVVLPEGTTLATTTTPTGPDPVKLFHAEAPALLAELQALLPQINAAAELSRRHDLLLEFGRKLHTLKGAAGHPELLPVWQLAGAVEGLVQQLADRAGNFTASTLRSVAGGVDLLPRLCVPGLRPDLLSHPPLRLLAVDDDLISRKAVALALKRALREPDLAESGLAALTLAELCRYDAIFLDVQMPGMDGFELCGKLHALETNRTTPVIFITSQDDFAARAQSVAVGGHDLISKPFLTFEITVKTLTLIFHHRLENPAVVGAPAAAAPRPRPVAPPPTVTATTASAPLAPTVEVTKIPTARPRRANPAPASPPPKAVRPAPVWEELPPTVTATAPAAPAAVIAAHIGINLATLREMFAALGAETAPHKQTEALGDIYLLQHALTLNVGAAQLPGAVALSAAVEALLQKLVLQPAHRSAATYERLTAALDLIAALNEGRVRPPRAELAAARLLVAAADLNAARELAGTLQQAFAKPDQAATAAAALKLAQEKKYAALLVTGQLPGTDALAFAAQLRETGKHRAAPLLYLLGAEDHAAHAAALRAAGVEVLLKPFLPAELHLQMLLLLLRGRAQPVAASQTD